MKRAALLAAAAAMALPGAHALTPLKGNVQAVYDMLERVLPGSSSHFALSTVASCPGVPAGQACFTMSDGSAGQIAIVGTSASELSAAVGVYFREYCNMTIGWPRGGGSNVFTPAVWPTLGGATVTTARIAPFSYIENVCTHSYSLVWYDWAAWERFIDWMALSGINMALAVTGQEEVQYKVFQQFGLDDLTIRSWFNGPAFLTWSRGQNEYGNNIAGPLPRSWMQAQWALQKQILDRYRALGITFQLPGFQGNVPWALAGLQSDSNITQQGDTGWMYSTDPLFAKIADAWMATLCVDFGCDSHVYQLDGYFDGGTAPWRTQGVGAPRSPGAIDAERQQGRVARVQAQARAELEGKMALPDPATADLPTCTWSSAQPGTYLAGCDDTNCISYTTVAAAQAACIADTECGGITSQANAQPPYELRASSTPAASPSGETSYYITNNAACRPPPGPIVPNSAWMERGAAAYMGLNRTDPDAVWSFQGWAIIDWSTRAQGESFSGFVAAVPQGKFIVIDMSTDGAGEWQKWQYPGVPFTPFFGAPFIWTTLHDFGGTDGMKGELDRINNIPFEALPPTTANASVLGTGYTPEGIDQNPAYYEFMAEANWRTAPVADITGHIIARSHRRYGLTQAKPEVTQAWTLLVNSTYAQDLSVQDGTGVPHFPGGSSQFQPDRITPTPRLCLVYQAWGQMIQASSYIDPSLETFRYDLVNLGREVLAQLSTPVSQNYSDAVHAKPINAALVKATGNLYISLLNDIDSLVGTDSAFLLGPWLDMAREWGANTTDCVAGTTPISCPDFYEWNARSQLTTWNPTPKGATVKPSGPDDYASKHWSGLIKDYYSARASGIQAQALSDAANGMTLNTTAVAQMEATLAYTFQNAYPNPYPLTPVGDAVATSKAMMAKYQQYYAAC